LEREVTGDCGLSPCPPTLEHIVKWLAEQSLSKPPAVHEIKLQERMVRVEEELRHQRELIKTILEQMDKRFDAVDKRFETMQSEMPRRFEDLPRRIDRFMFWSFTITLTVGSFVVAALKLLL